MPSINIVNLGIGMKNSWITSASLSELCSSIFTDDTGGRMALFLDTVVFRDPSLAMNFSACHRSVFPHWYFRDNPNKKRSRTTLRSWSNWKTPLRVRSVLRHTVTIVSSRKLTGEIDGRARKSSVRGLARTSFSKYSTKALSGMTAELCS